MDMERWDAWLERLIVSLVAGALGFGILAFGGVRVREFLVIEGLVALALVLWLLRVWTAPGQRLLWPPVCWGVLLMAGWAVWRTFEAELQYIAWAECLRVLTYTALFFVIVNNLHRQDTAQGLAWFLIGLATLLCFYAAWQFISASNLVWGLGRSPDYVHRGSGSFASPNSFAGLLALLIPLALAVVLAGRVKPLGRILIGYCGVVMLAGLALTFSRGGWMAAAVGVLVVLLPLARNRDYRWAALACLALLLIGGGYALMRSDLARTRIAGAQDLNPEARNSRPHIWRATVRMWQSSPVFGVGPDHFSPRFKQFRTWQVHGEPDRAHNDYLNALADWGVAGVAVAAIPLGLLLYGSFRTLRQVRREPGDLEVKRSSRYALVLGAIAGLTAFATHSLVDFNLHVPGVALVAVTWMALLTGYSRYATDDWWVSSRWPWRIGASLFVILPLLAVLGWDLNRRTRETIYLERARLAGSASDAQLAAYQAAWDVEPRNAWTAYAIGEVHRLRSFTGMPGYEELGRQALPWFDRAAALNPYEPAFVIRAGMTLDWLGDHEGAGRYFATALKQDPEGRITSFYQGWHELQKGDRAKAREWFVKSTEQGWPQYDKALTYLRMLDGLPAAPPSPANPPSPAPSSGP